MEVAGVGHATSDVPVGQSGPWIIDRYEVVAPRADVRDGRADWAISPPGAYTRLRLGNRIFMTDQVDEWWTQRPAIIEATRRGGRVLLTGLGLGLVAESMLNAPIVERVVIVEASSDVIALVGPFLEDRYGPRIEIVHASAFDWAPQPGARFTVGWHDIWENPVAPECEPEERELVARYGPYCDWQGTWSAQWREDDAAARRST